MHDVRHPTRDFNVGNGIKRNGKRLLTVGTDVSVGKMFTSLAIEQEMLARKLKAKFIATGQTGIFIAGEKLDKHNTIKTGDFIYVPPNAPHKPVNTSNKNSLILMVSRNQPMSRESS